MEKIISKIAGLGVSGLILLTAISATGYVGAPAVTVALATIGPGGMVAGVVTLLITGLLTESITEFGFDAIFTGVVRELNKRGENTESILRKIERYPVSKSLKRKLKEELQKV